MEMLDKMCGYTQNSFQLGDWGTFVGNTLFAYLAYETELVIQDVIHSYGPDDSEEYENPPKTLQEAIERANCKAFAMLSEEKPPFAVPMVDNSGKVIGISIFGWHRDKMGPDDDYGMPDDFYFGKYEIVSVMVPDFEFLSR